MHQKCSIRKWGYLLIWVISFELIGYFMGQLTQANLEPWYQSLNKSSLTPPGIVFSIIWSMLYALLAYIGWLLSVNRNNPLLKNALILYAIQMLLNWVWTPLFFEYKWIGFSLLCLICITCLTGIMILALRKQAMPFATLLLPYFLWLLFATYLNGMIWILN